MAAHDAVLEQVLRLGTDVGADIEQHARPLERRHDGGDAGPADVLEEQPQGEARRDHGAGVAGTDDGLHLALGQELPAAADGVVRLLAQGHDRRFFHGDDLVQWKISRRSRTAWALASKRFDLGLIADQDNAQVRIGLNGLHGAADDRPGSVVAAHRVQRDLHGLLLLFFSLRQPLRGPV